jgi:predicted acetyltransferase
MGSFCYAERKRLWNFVWLVLRTANLLKTCGHIALNHGKILFFNGTFLHFISRKTFLWVLKTREMACLTHLNPYELSLRGKKIPVSYIVGLATHPAARRGGVGGKLLSAALKEMRRRKQYLNILMPSKAGFYQHYGYEMYCHQWKETIRLEELRPLTDKTVRFGFVNNTDQWTYLAGCV